MIMPSNSATTGPPRTKVFISYCHRDRKWLDGLLVHLKPLERSMLTEVWADTRIDPGKQWLDEVRAALATTKVAILLISIHFINSDFITENELPPLLKAAEDEGVLILPLIVGRCANRFQRTPDLCRFQAVNDPKTPVSAMTVDRREALWDQLAGRIQDYLAESGTT
jgi:hypothetical protein